MSNYIHKNMSTTQTQAAPVKLTIKERRMNREIKNYQEFCENIQMKINKMKEELTSLLEKSIIEEEAIEEKEKKLISEFKITANGLN